MAHRYTAGMDAVSGQPQSSAPDSLAQPSNAPEQGTPIGDLAVYEGYPDIYRPVVYKDVAITLWYDAPSMVALAPYGRRGLSLLKRFPSGLSSIHIMVPGGKSMPTAQCRHEFARLMRRFSPHLAASAVIIPGGGFWASAMRGAITALLLMAPKNFHLRVFADPEALAHWLPPIHAAKTGTELTPCDLHRVLQQVLQDYARPRPARAVPPRLNEARRHSKPLAGR